MDRDRLVEKRRLRTLIRASLEGVALVPDETRYGPGSLARHVVGHVRANAYADPRDNAGESGLERVFDERLRGGEPAWAGVVTTGEGLGMPGTGVMIAPPSMVPPDLYTTIDASVQLQVERTLDERGVRKGAVVVLDVETAGSVLKPLLLSLALAESCRILSPCGPVTRFCGWTPLIVPRYLICVFVEEGGDGPSVAAPIFRDIASLVLP